MLFGYLSFGENNKKRCVTIKNTLGSEEVLWALLAKTNSFLYEKQMTTQVSRPNDLRKEKNFFHVDFKKKTRIVGRKSTRRRERKRDQLFNTKGEPGAMGLI